jgi:hypothetical protein
MKFTTNPKENTMKNAATTSYVRLVAVLAVAAPIALYGGSFRGW